jgi:hypothetical protein
MKSLSGTSFFRLFDMLAATNNPGLRLDRWAVDDVRFERERHSFSGRTHCYAIDVFMLSRPGRRSWTLMVAKEYWWDGDHKRAIRMQSWSRPIEGSRRDIMAWLRGQEIDLQRQEGVFVDRTKKAG